MIKSLPSTYGGVLFRSRLEARWAALFDHYSLKWVYEPDGFATPSGNYLPDFYFPDLHTYAEVKPGPGMFDLTAVQHVAQQTKSTFLILDSPVVECRSYPLLAAHESDCFWNDMVWCASAPYLGLNPRENKHRFYIGTGADHALEHASSECFYCDNRYGSRHEGQEFRQARNLRFNNGVAP